MKPINLEVTVGNTDANSLRKIENASSQLRINNLLEIDKMEKLIGQALISKVGWELSEMPPITGRLSFKLVVTEVE